MTEFKVFNIELEGIDKCGKDSIRPYIWYLEPGKYLCRARGLLSQLAYDTLYNRELSWNAESYCRNTLFVLLDVNEDDWKIRCEMTNEPKLEFTFDEMRNAFIDALKYATEHFHISPEQILRFDTSTDTPYSISKRIVERLTSLNG